MLRRTVPALIASLVAASLVPAASAGTAGSYIVVLRDGTEAPGSVARDHARAGARVDHVYDHALNGYSATMSEAAAAQISNDPRVSYVVPDGEVTKDEAGTQSPATWGLDRIDQRSLPLNSTYTYGTSGAGVTAYIIDSGVSNHPDFDGRLSSGIDYVNDDADSTDCDGHGTHVAGTIGSETWGVAQDVSMIGVRVLDCSGSGSWSDVIAGIDWVTAHHAAGAPAVANMSLGGGANSAVDDAVAASIADGVTYAVAAGNGDRAGRALDACGRSPARAPAALTVGATNSSDAKASWSNYGTCVDLFAPGVAITSTVMSGGTESWNGTSMATPHVAGAAALYLETAPTASAAAVASAITSGATAGVVSGAGTGSPNRLLYVGPADVIDPDPTPDPTADTATVQSITYAPGGRKGADLMITVTVVDNLGAPVANAATAIAVDLNGSQYGTASGSTGSAGTVTFKLRNAPKGSYGTRVTSVSASGLQWDGNTPANSYVKS